MHDPLAGSLIIFIGTFLLAGECLVKARGVFGFIGFILYIFYLYQQLVFHSPFWLIAILVAGVLFVVLDGLLITNGSVAFVGLIIIMLSLAVASPTLSYGIGVSVAYWLGLLASLFLIKTMQPRQFWRRLALFDQSTSEAGYNSLNEKTRSYLGKSGVTVSILRPVGTIEIEGDRLSAMTNGEWVESGREVEVVAIDGTKVVVKPLKPNLNKN